MGDAGTAASVAVPFFHVSAYHQGAFTSQPESTVTEAKRLERADYQRIYQLRRYHLRRAAAIATLGGKCVGCGSRENLELDHRDPAQKSFAISQLWGISAARFEAELRKCQLLCTDCHREKSWAGDDLVSRRLKRCVCECGAIFADRFEYAGHRRWCTA